MVYRLIEVRGIMIPEGSEEFVRGVVVRELDLWVSQQKQAESGSMRAEIESELALIEDANPPEPQEPAEL